MRLSCLPAFCRALLSLGVATGFVLTASAGNVDLRFLDSATGLGIRPEVRLERAGAAPQIFTNSAKITLDLENGDYSLTITKSNYAPMTAAVVVHDEPQRLHFTLDPWQRPAEIGLEGMATYRRGDATLFVGYVGDEATGEPLAGARVWTEPGGAETQTDARGFFRIHVPLQDDLTWRVFPAKLLFAKAGYQTDEHRNLELWSNGDWIYPVSLKTGGGTNVVDEGGRRLLPVAMPAPSLAEAAPKKGEVAGVTSSATHATNATPRLPTNIRVYVTNAPAHVEYVSMETYTARSLSQEWISGWGSYAGGMDSMKAGAVAVRSYAIAKINAAGSASTNDICATTSCQVYRANSTANANAAVAATPGYVIVLGATIQSSEYSSENNSLGFSCGDGFTQPTSGCISDPVCTGEDRFGHGRGMCQWGTAKWATGLKFPNNSTSDHTTTNGYPKQDWIWIVNHYFPNLTLVQAKPLVVGDDVKVVGSLTRDVRMCGDGSISSGVDCPLITTKTVGSTGVITEGPVLVTADGRGFTWWKVTWTGGVVGWMAENWLDRVIPVPAAPQSLVATAQATNRVGLTWTEQVGMKVGYKVERAAASGGPWTQIADVETNALSAYVDVGATMAATNYYRLRAYNLGGNSAYSGVVSAVTPGIVPVLAAIPNQTVVEGALLTFTNTATATDAGAVTTLADFESDALGSTALFRLPNFSGSTASFLLAAPVVSAVTNNFPAGSGLGDQVTAVSWAFTNVANPWLRLTTSGAGTRPSPVIDFTERLRFDIYTDKDLRIGLGLRETTNAAGTALGANGGSAGAIEFVGATNLVGAQPQCVRLVRAGAWTNLTFDLPNEPAVNFVNGNGVLGTASGLGVLEHLTLAPGGSNGTYNIYVDNLTVVPAKTLAFSLDAGAPAGATVDPVTGVFAWTPSEAQGPGAYSLTVRVTDDSAIPQSATRTFTVTVTETNAAPVLAAIPDQTVHAGMILTWTNLATDADLPTNARAFSLDAGFPAGASVGGSNGRFTWTPGDAQAGAVYPVTVRVTDNGSPQKSDAKTFQVSVQPRPTLAGSQVTAGGVKLVWNTIPGRAYRVEAKEDLNTLTWTHVEDVIAAGVNISITNAPGSGARFYRIVVLP